MDLNKEAEKYASYNFDSGYLDIDDHFIAGANSKYVQAKILQAQIDVIDKIIDNSNVLNYSYVLVNNRYELENQLKQLDDE